jgi:hypothetical protein
MLDHRQNIYENSDEAFPVDVTPRTPRIRKISLINVVVVVVVFFLLEHAATAVIFTGLPAKRRTTLKPRLHYTTGLYSRLYNRLYNRLQVRQCAVSSYTMVVQPAV